MDAGKKICKTLKELRRRIAKANDIPFEPEECSYDGPCRGTCPRCEQEVRQLESALDEKERRGETVYRDDLMAEEELCSQVVNDKPMTEDDMMMLPAGIPAPPEEEMMRWEFERDLVSAILECIKLESYFPDVAIYIDPFGHDVIVIKQPGLEQDALFGFEYCDWRQFVKNGEVCYSLIELYVNEWIKDKDGDGKALQGDIADPDDGEILSGYVEGVNHLDNRQLALTVAERIFAENRNNNVVFSPLGIAAILSMLQCGTADDSLASDLIEDLLDGFCPERFTGLHDKAIQIEHASGMWYDKSLGFVKRNFLAALQQKFGTKPAATNFGDTDTVRSNINQWVANHTHDKITKLDINLSADTFMVLVDAIFLKAKWETPFDEEDTRKRSFNNADGTTTKVDMMHIRHSFAYESTDDYQNVVLDYAGAPLFMTIVLPKKGKDIYEIMRTDNWLEPDPGFEDYYDVDLRLPKFKFDERLELKEVLTSLGLGDLFDTETSLSEMTNKPAHVGRICQQCNISIDECGTEAAAASFAEMEVGCLPPDIQPKYHRMTVDRPFGFAIWYGNLTILFMGVVNNLGKDESATPPKNVRNGKYITSMTVAGTSHIKNIDELAEDIDVGTELRLVHETNNKYDRNAIGVYLGDNRVGFVPRSENQILARLLDAGLELFASVNEASWRGDWLNIQANILLADKN